MRQVATNPSLSDEEPNVNKEDWAIAVFRRFREAPNEALFGNPEKSALLDVSESWLEKGNGPRTRRVGRLRKSTKGDILDFLQGLED